jgi:hypothetical protein
MTRSRRGSSASMIVSLMLACRRASQSNSTIRSPFVHSQSPSHSHRSYHTESILPNDGATATEPPFPAGTGRSHLSRDCRSHYHCSAIEKNDEMLDKLYEVNKDERDTDKIDAIRLSLADLRNLGVNLDAQRTTQSTQGRLMLYRYIEEPTQPVFVRSLVIQHVTRLERCLLRLACSPRFCLLLPFGFPLLARISLEFD